MSTPTDGLSEADKDRLHAEEMKLRQAERRAERATKKERGGLLMILTGPGKGKSSSAFGMVARALGWDMRIGIVQFIKGKWQTGEKHFFRRFPELVTFEVTGDVRSDGRRFHLGRAGPAARYRRGPKSLATQLRADRRSRL
jgi:cob(I)alamin adenosyltransferase